MIYDHMLTVYTRDPASGPIMLRLQRGNSYFYGEREVYASRFYQAMQAGEQLDRMAELWRCPIHADEFVQLWDFPAEIYRVVQAQHGENPEGLAITTLSLRRETVQYELASD